MLSNWESMVFIKERRFPSYMTCRVTGFHHSWLTRHENHKSTVTLWKNLMFIMNHKAFYKTMNDPFKGFLCSVWIREVPWRATAPDTKLQRSCNWSPQAAHLWLLHRKKEYLQADIIKETSKQNIYISYLWTAIDHFHLLTPHSFLFSIGLEWNMKV